MKQQNINDFISQLSKSELKEVQEIIQNKYSEASKEEIIKSEQFKCACNIYRECLELEKVTIYSNVDIKINFMSANAVEILSEECNNMICNRKKEIKKCYDKFYNQCKILEETFNYKFVSSLVIDYIDGVI